MFNFRKLFSKHPETTQNNTKVNDHKKTFVPKKDYSRPEAIFTVPEDIDNMDWEDAICHTLDRIQGTIITTAQLMNSNTELPYKAVHDCLQGVLAQTEIVEKLVRHKANNL